MSDIFKITQVTEGDLRGKKIAELSDRPNQPSGFSQGLTAQELKDRFDAFPDVVKDKINEIADMLSSEDATEYFSIESPIYKTLREFLSLFGEKSSADGLNIVDFIYARYALENETSKRWHSLSQIFDQIKADIAELKAGVQPPTPPDDGGDDGGETPPTPPEGGDDGGETPPTPPDDGGDDGGGTTPPEGGGDGEEDGGDEPSVYTEDVEYNGVSEAVVPSNALTTASLLNVGGLSKISKNYANYSEVITIESGGSKRMVFVLENKTKYIFRFKISGEALDTSRISASFGNSTGSEQYTTEESSFSEVADGIFCRYVFSVTSAPSVAILVSNNSKETTTFSCISLTKYNDGESNMDSATINGNSIKTIRHQNNGVIKDVVLPDAVCSNSVFGHGFGSYTNRYNVEDGVLEENVKVVKGSELTWTNAFLSEYGARYVYAELPSPCIDHAVECSPLAHMVFKGNRSDNGIDVVAKNGRSYVAFSVGANFSSAGNLAENITFIYALKEPNKIPIANGFDGLIDVEPNGVIQTLNENGEQVKSNFAVRYVLQE